VKILYVIPLLGCGGAEILLGATALELRRKGHDVRIICLTEADETYLNYPDRELLESLIPITIIEEKVILGFLKDPVVKNQRFKEYVENFRPDVIHSHLYLAELLAHAYIFPAIRYFSHGHDNMPQLKKFSLATFGNKMLLTNWWERRWLKKRYMAAQNEFIAISRDVESFFKRELPPALRTKIHYLANAINTKRFKNPERSYMPLNESPFHIVSVANLVKKKNHVLLIEVMKVLKQQGYNVSMEILGAGVLMEMLVSKTKEYGLEDRLFFRGSVGDVEERLRNAQLYVHPASYEPFGLVIIEAMASGLPVVSLDGYGNRELMKEGENGFMLATDATAEMFAEKISWLMKNTAERERMGRNAAEFALNYDIGHYAEKLMEIYLGAKQD